jgi:hypothetical protein
VKLSIVIICWNDLKVLRRCLESIYEQTKSADFEVIISDNASADGSAPFVREHYPQVRMVENGRNLGYARGNNAGIAVARGEYVLILNPDTIVHERALDRWVAYADRHPEAGAFGCRVLNPDGSFQDPARPFPTIGHYWQVALRLRQNTYRGWQGETEREIDWQSGCCILFRGDLLRELGGFDGRFFYHYEEVDLCYRVRQAGYKILYTPEVVITHLGGQSVGRYPVRFELEKYRNRYRYFHKHFGQKGARRCRRVSLAHLGVRRLGYGVASLFKRDQAMRNRLEMLRVVSQWNWELDPERFVETGEEPSSGYEPLTME